jgi:two-component system, LytTR family, response regulator LytT
MNAVILEDEELSARRLSNLLTEIDSSLKIEQTLESVETAVKWLKTHPHPSVIFMDIQLSDGLSFEIFKLVDIYCPVIFTTAYDEYALKAFKVNSIDYLLKPVDKEELTQSLHKLDEIKWQYLGGHESAVEKLLHNLDETKRVYKSRFLIKNGQNLITIFDKDAAYFLTDRKLTFLVTWNGKKHPLNESLEELEEKLDARSFFRLNRQYIVSVNSIESVHTFFNYRLKVFLKPQTDKEVIVSRKHVKAFKAWLNG